MSRHPLRCYLKGDADKTPVKDSLGGGNIVRFVQVFLGG